MIELPEHIRGTVGMVAPGCLLVRPVSPRWWWRSADEQQIRHIAKQAGYDVRRAGKILRLIKPGYEWPSQNAAYHASAEKRKSDRGLVTVRVDVPESCRDELIEWARLKRMAHDG